MRLWEADHPYYCSEGNFFRRGMHTRYGSFDEFLESWGYLDEDMNLVFRWDWIAPEDPNEHGRLLVFWVLQRKAILRSTECEVTSHDEPEVRSWLTRKARKMREVWTPLLNEVQ